MEANPKSQKNKKPGDKISKNRDIKDYEEMNTDNYDINKASHPKEVLYTFLFKAIAAFRYSLTIFLNEILYKFINNH